MGRPGSPKRPPRSFPKEAPRSPRRPKEAPRTPLEPRFRPRWPRAPARRAQEPPKTSPRRPQEVPRRPQDGRKKWLRGPQETPSGPQERSKAAPDANITESVILMTLSKEIVVFQWPERVKMIQNLCKNCPRGHKRAEKVPRKSR